VRRIDNNIRVGKMKKIEENKKSKRIGWKAGIYSRRNCLKRK
jgi:hypothetical protein